MTASFTAPNLISAPILSCPLLSKLSALITTQSSEEPEKILQALLKKGETKTKDGILIITNDHLETFNSEIQVAVREKLSDPEQLAVTLHLTTDAQGKSKMMTDSNQTESSAVIIIKQDCLRNNHRLTDQHPLPPQTIIAHELRHARRAFGKDLALLEKLGAASSDDKTLERLRSLIYELDPFLQAELPFYLARADYPSIATALWTFNYAFATWNQLIAEATGPAKAQLEASRADFLSEFNLSRVNRALETRLPSLFYLDPNKTLESFQREAKENCMLLRSWIKGSVSISCPE